MSTAPEDLLLLVDHVKYRKAGEGRSPIGRLAVYRECVEWRDNASNDSLLVKFIQIKGQRVSPPTKSKVQLQLCLQNEDQATFVFLDPSKNPEGLLSQRETFKEILQQALVDHRSRVNQLAASHEKCSKSAELEAKQKILLQNKHLEQLYQHLVGSKLLLPHDFWADYYTGTNASEDKTGISGSFLANIAQQNGTEGVKLNLNTEIIQAIFNTYPAVERKHLEVVPHEMNESTFWRKFFESHYYHRERDVLPNPSDPFADCVRIDEAEIDKLVKEGVTRKRFDMDHLQDNNLADFVTKSERAHSNQKTTLVRRCNYLSERIIGCLRASEPEVKPESAPSTAGKGFAALNRIHVEDESRLESSELGEAADLRDTQTVTLKAASQATQRNFPPEQAQAYKKIMLDYLDTTSVEDIIAFDGDDDGFPPAALPNANGKGKSEANTDTSDWGLTVHDMAEVRSVHEAVAELLKHFWTCLPANTPELEAKFVRMESALRQYESTQLARATQRYGTANLQHCYNMLEKAYERFRRFEAGRKK